MRVMAACEWAIDMAGRGVEGGEVVVAGTQNGCESIGCRTARHSERAASNITAIIPLLAPKGSPGVSVKWERAQAHAAGYFLRRIDVPHAYHYWKARYGERNVTKERCQSMTIAIPILNICLSMPHRILITGASVAGNTAAWALGRAGHDVSVLERSPTFRDGGQNIDVRGSGREVLRRMGLEQAALDRGTGEEGTAWVNGDGKIVAKFLTRDLQEDGPTAEMEILRGDLALILYDAAREHARYRFGDEVAAVDDQGDAVQVRFQGGGVDRFDALIVAEGVGSSTRDLVFPGVNDQRWMDLVLAYFTIPRTGDDDKLWRWYHAPGGRSISLRPDRHGTTRAMLSVQKPAEGEQDWEVQRQKDWLHKTFSDAGWQASRVLAGLKHTDDFYFDVLRQVRLSSWHQGRIVLVGDAAWCATPLAGIGTTLAITGAYALAGEIALSQDLSTAFDTYEQVMRPMVEAGQSVPKIGPRLMNPHSRLGIALLHGALHVASAPGLKNVATKLFANPPDGPNLTKYFSA